MNTDDHKIHVRSLAPPPQVLQPNLSPHICHFEQTILLLSNFSSSLSSSPHVQQPLSKSSNLSSGRRGSLWITWPLFEVASNATSLQVSQSLLMLKTSLQITQPLIRPQKLSLIHTTTIRGCIECNLSSSHTSIPGLQYNRVAKCRDLWNEKQEP